MTRGSIPPPGSDASPEEEGYRKNLQAFQEEGKTILNGFFICLRMAHLYDPGNEAFRRPLNALKAGLDAFMREQGPLKVMFSEGQVYMNDTRLKVDASSFEWVSGLVSFFEERQVGGLGIAAPQSAGALSTLFRLLVKAPRVREEGDASQREELMKALEDGGVRDLELLRPMALTDEEWEESSEEREGREIIGEAVSMYIAGLVAFKNLALGKGKAASMLRMTRVVQSLADAQEKVGGDLVALSTVRGGGEFLPNHAMNVCVLSLAVGRMLPLSKEELSDLALGAILHDIGKFSEAGSDENYQNHPYESFRIIMGQGEFSRSLLLRGLIALDHHLSFDGSKGFPYFRLGRKPHLLARIVALADAYDVLTTPMGDEDPILPDVALRSILKQAGSIFDPAAARLFVETLGKYPVGTLVEIDSGDVGVVLKSGRGDMRMMRPLVLVVRDRYGNDVEGGAVIDTNERHEHRKAYKHSIVCSHDPGKLGINVSGYLFEFLSR